jgi:hypothetical protein
MWHIFAARKTKQLKMTKTITTILAATLFALTSQAQLNQLKNKVKDKKESIINGGEQKQAGNSGQESLPVITAEQFAAKPYSSEDRLLKIENDFGIIKGLYAKNYTDRIQLSGFYYLNKFLSIPPANHFSSDTLKLFGGFSIDYNPDLHTMQVHFSSTDSNYAMIPEEHVASSDKGNVLFKFGMQGGPEELYNVECLVLEPGVILLGANVYHKNDEIGHQWMNNITPEFFYIAARDTAKFKEYQTNPEYTSKVVFEKFDRLREVRLGQAIKDAKPLPKQGMTDPKLKADALDLIQRTATAYQWKEKVEYAYIVSTEWEIRRHPITDVPLKRIVKAIVVMQTPQGNYKREGFYVAQDYTGNGNYGQTYMLYNDQRIYYVNPNDAMQYK